MVLGVVLSIIAGAVLLKVHPYVEASDNTIATVGMWVLCVINFAELLKRVRQLLDQSGDSIAGKDQEFDSAYVDSFAYAGFYMVPGLALAYAFVETAANLWRRLLGEHEGSAVADELKATALWRRPLLLCGIGMPAMRGRAGDTQVTGSGVWLAPGSPAAPASNAPAALAAAAPTASTATEPRTDSPRALHPPLSEQSRPRAPVLVLQSLRRAYRDRPVRILPMMTRSATAAPRPVAAPASPRPPPPGSSDVSDPNAPQTFSVSNPLFVRSLVRRDASLEPASAVAGHGR
jgi:hypothetical protein